jgi:hypothetical protein
MLRLAACWVLVVVRGWLWDERGGCFVCSCPLRRVSQFVTGFMLTEATSTTKSTALIAYLMGVLVHNCRVSAALGIPASGIPLPD